MNQSANQPIIEVNVHNCTVNQALLKIDKEVKQAGKGVYRIRVIHGFHGGTRIRDAIRQEYYFGLNDKVKNVVCGTNQGITELVLREY